MSLNESNNRERPRKVKPQYPLKNGFSADLLKVVNVPPIFELRLHGTIDHRTAHYFQNILSSIIEPQGTNLILNFKELSYASSAAWPIISSAAHRLKTLSLDLSVTELNGAVKNTFYMLEFNNVVKIFETINEAIRYFERLSDVGTGNPETNSVSQTNRATQIADEVTEELPIDTAMSDDFFIDTKAIPSNLMHFARRDFGTAENIPGKIKLLLKNYGPLSFFEIKRFLKLKEFGENKVGIIKLYSILKSMNLDSRGKIERFCRSV
jgi:anti-anti-sigma factor